MTFSKFRTMHFFVAAIACMLMVVAGLSNSSATTIVFRVQDADAVPKNHLIVRDRGLVDISGPLRLESDGVYSGSELVAPWYQIVDGNVGSELQDQFQSRLRTWGQPLYLLRSRLERGDWFAANIAATQIEPYVGDSDHATRAVMRFARFRSSLAAGNPEFAVVPLLELCRDLNERPELKDPFFDPLMRDIELQQAVSGLLVPVWSNRSRAEAAWTTLQELIPGDTSGMPAGWYVYGVSLGIAADDLAGAEKLLNSWNAVSEKDLAWKRILTGSLAVAMEKLVLAETELTGLLASKRDSLSPLQVATANWWLAVCLYRQNLALSVRSSFREMIAVAAISENDWPVIAESALLAALSVADGQGWNRESFVIERELELLRARRLRYNLPDRR